ncbi:hypothetical protein N6L24_01455 [Cognatishimia sp. SS12]|uniref:hypothetical protein n=1 Tax=Cognatishimia sp. SS12 TaxID=2979465 RepID=UPI00232D0CB6|nr:hypothetical protein [Cognatishimia sp. SS12]MDC0736934.1 hypothetical protein [Cognatishimia sp. SS12]
MNADNLLLIGGTMALLLAVAGFVLTQRNAWRVILLLVALLGGLNIGIFIWSEILEGWSSFRLFLFWIAAILPPLVGLAVGAGLGAFVNWRIARIDLAKERKKGTAS